MIKVYSFYSANSGYILMRTKKKLSVSFLLIPDQSIILNFYNLLILFWLYFLLCVFLFAIGCWSALLHDSNVGKVLSKCSMLNRIYMLLGVSNPRGSCPLRIYHTYRDTHHTHTYCVLVSCVRQLAVAEVHKTMCTWMMMMWACKNMKFARQCHAAIYYRITYHDKLLYICERITIYCSRYSQSRNHTG